MSLFVFCKNYVNGPRLSPTQHLVHFNYFILIWKNLFLPYSLAEKSHESRSISVCFTLELFHTVDGQVDRFHSICHLIPRAGSVRALPISFALYFSVHQPSLQFPALEFLCLRSFPGF